MQKKVLFLYSCDICKAEFSSFQEEEAIRLVKNCENQGTLVRHRFKIGDDKINVPSGLSGKKENGTIRDCYYKEFTHEPYYSVSFVLEPFYLVGVKASEAWRQVSGEIEMKPADQPFVPKDGHLGTVGRGVLP